jgi:PIF1-like helicase
MKMKPRQEERSRRSSTHIVRVDGTLPNHLHRRLRRWWISLVVDDVFCRSSQCQGKDSTYPVSIASEGGVEMEELEPAGLAGCQGVFKDVKYLIVDEKSMISLRVLLQIHQRCAQIFPNAADRPFGGLNIIMCGDFYQLPPVGSRPLFFNERSMPLDEELARDLYLQFDQTIMLKVNMRQHGQDSDAIQFRTALAHLRKDEVTGRLEVVESEVQVQSDNGGGGRICQRRSTLLDKSGGGAV